MGSDGRSRPQHLQSIVLYSGRSHIHTNGCRGGALGISPDGVRRVFAATTSQQHLLQLQIPNAHRRLQRGGFWAFCQNGVRRIFTVIKYQKHRLLQWQIRTNTDGCREGPSGFFPNVAGRGHKITKALFSTWQIPSTHTKGCRGDIWDIFPNGARRVFVATTRSQKHCFRRVANSKYTPTAAEGDPFRNFPKWGPTAGRGHRISKASFSTAANCKYAPAAADGDPWNFFPNWDPTATRDRNISEALFSTAPNSKYTPTAAEGGPFGSFLSGVRWLLTATESQKHCCRQCQITHTPRARGGIWGFFPTGSDGCSRPQHLKSIVLNSGRFQLHTSGCRGGPSPNGVRRQLAATTSQKHCLLLWQAPNRH